MKTFSIGLVCLVALFGLGVRDASARPNCESIEVHATKAV